MFSMNLLFTLHGQIIILFVRCLSGYGVFDCIHTFHSIAYSISY